MSTKCYNSCQLKISLYLVSKLPRWFFWRCYISMLCFLLLRYWMKSVNTWRSARARRRSWSPCRRTDRSCWTSGGSSPWWSTGSSSVSTSSYPSWWPYSCYTDHCGAPVLVQQGFNFKAKFDLLHSHGYIYSSSHIYVTLITVVCMYSRISISWPNLICLSKKSTVIGNHIFATLIIALCFCKVLYCT